jgi:hypothetical protein
MLSPKSEPWIIVELVFTLFQVRNPGDAPGRYATAASCRHTRMISQLIVHNFFFFLVSWGGVRLSPLGTSATIWPIVPAPDNRL